jgi:alpha-galactosidase/6-phospho-beta-glucosidase family protein
MTKPVYFDSCVARVLGVNHGIATAEEREDAEKLVTQLIHDLKDSRSFRAEMMELLQDEFQEQERQARLWTRERAKRRSRKWRRRKERIDELIHSIYVLICIERRSI